jgi:cation:H+ antiporter
MARTAPAPTLGGTLSSLPVWKARLAAMAACTAPGVFARLGGVHVPPPIGCLVFGAAVIAAGFILGAAAEVAEVDLPSGLAVAGVAFVAVLPEYVIEVFFALSGQAELVTASLTGATRLLLSFAVGMPALAAGVMALRGRQKRRRVRRQREVMIKPEKRIDLAVIAAASAYSPLIVLRGRLTWSDAIVLIGLYILYLRRISGGDPEPPHLVGIAAEIGKLPKRERKRWTFGLMAFAAVAILVTAEPFAHAVMGTGMLVGISPYLLVQWLVPIATEMPELVVAFVLVTHQRAAQGVAVLLSSAVSQWTLALGTLPVAYAIGPGKGPLPLLGPERVELLLTMALALLAVASLVTLKLRRSDATLMLVLFVLQLLTPSPLLRAGVTLIYLVVAFDILTAERWAIPALFGVLRGRSPEQETGHSPPVRSGRRSPASAE